MMPNQRTLVGYRWVICGLLFVATAINYMDRQILGLLAVPIQADIGWSQLDYGRLVLCFQAAYAVGLLFFGLLIDRFGTKRSYAAAIFCWSCAAVAHAAASTVVTFGVVRVLLGLGEAGNFPAAIKSVAEWFPKKERALATGIFNAGSNAGAILAPLIIPWIAVAWGWRWAFIVIGALGFVWIPLWWWLYARPAQSARVSPSELNYIQQDGPDEETQPVSWGKLLGYRQTWAFMIGKLMTDPIFWFYLFWLPKWLGESRHMDLKSIGAPLVAIYVMATLGSIGGGFLSSALLRRGLNLNRSRKFAMLACAVSVVPIVAVSQIDNLWICVGIIGLAAAAHQGWSANIFTTVSDLFPKRAIASVVGLGGMAGAVGGMIFAEATGRILDATNGEYYWLFAMGAGAYLTALAVFHLLVPRMKPVEL